jgi:hypothetical protein
LANAPTQQLLAERNIENVYESNPWTIEPNFPAFKNPNWQNLETTSTIRLKASRSLKTKGAPELQWTVGQ